MSCFSFSLPSTSEIYTLSLHDALPIFNPGTELDHAVGRDVEEVRDVAGVARHGGEDALAPEGHPRPAGRLVHRGHDLDRKSTRLNSSHEWISYAVFCLKKKKKNININK